MSPADEGTWAFRAVRRPSVPGGVRPGNGSEAVDAFVEAALRGQGLQARAPATPREQVRRLHFDLIGLPPSPEEVEAFERDPSDAAWARRVEELLARPQYGERWGRHWLDVARFAQSNGYERDGEKPESWRYRDYVVRAFNADKPYDRFIREQIAGDELEGYDPDAVVATGFLRLGVWDDEPDDKRMAEFDELDDVLSTTGSVFLGLTLGCARCHEHKSDPFPQSDYYGLLAFFRNVRPSEAPKYVLESANYAPLAPPDEVRAWRDAVAARIAAIEARRAGTTNEAERGRLAAEIEKVRGEKAPFEWALAAREHGGEPPPTHVLKRGNASQPGTEVAPGFPRVLCAVSSVVPKPTPRSGAAGASAGRRRVLADWIASPDNPLTARVLVNRVWKHHFGRGLVRTTSDFGRNGARPTHPELLDWLAAEFVEGGWSIKALHRTIMMSRAYRRSSRADDAVAQERDPDNQWLWRQNLRRLEAEAVRDTLLALGGTLNLRMGGRGYFPRLSGEVLAGQSRPGLDWEVSPPDELARRSLYAYVRRTMMVPMLDAFDYSNTTSPLSERPNTTVAPQALILLNDGFVQEQAVAMAARIVREAGATPSEFVERGYRLATGRVPTSEERALGTRFLARQRDRFAARAGRLTFQADVPPSLSVSYLDKLPPGRFLLGPSLDWSYYRGRWSGVYEGIRTLDRDRGPFALYATTGFTHGTISLTLEFATAGETAGVLFRASAAGDELRGYELELQPREDRVVLRRHGSNIVELASAPARLPVGNGHGIAVRVQADGPRIRAWLGEGADPLIEVTDAGGEGPSGGRIGIRAWGAPVDVDGLRIQAADSGETVVVHDRGLASPEERARQAFCLLLLNLNETIYVD